jgi:hypothetical protein
MIIFEPGGAKNLILVVLVVFFTGIIVWQWIANNPFANVETENYFLNQIKNNTSDEVGNIKDSISGGKEDLEKVGDEIIKETKQAQLIEETKKYLEDKINISEWEIYKNDKYNFSIAIPSEYRSRALYDDVDVPLDSDLSSFYLVNDGKSIMMDTEDRSLYNEEGTLDNILAQRAEDQTIIDAMINTFEFTN